MLMLKQKELELSNLNMVKNQQQYRIEKMNSEQQFMLTSRQRDSLQLWNSTLKQQQDSVTHLRQREALESEMKEKEQKIAELLKGEVWIDTSYTDGARFVFSMPVSDIFDITANT